MYIDNSFPPPRISLSILLLYAVSKRILVYAYFAPQNPGSRFDRVPVDNASIVARLDGDDSGKASLGIIRFVPISSPSSFRVLLRRLLTLVSVPLLLLFQPIPRQFLRSRIVEQSNRLLRRNRRIWENIVIGSNSATLLLAEDLTGT